MNKNTKIQRAPLVKWHQRLALICVLFLLASTTSGLSRTIDKIIPDPDSPISPTMPIQLEQLILNAAQAHALLDPQLPIQSVECRTIAGEAWWQFIIASPKPIFHAKGQFGPPLFVDPLPYYVNAQDGRIERATLDHIYALEIATATTDNTVIIDEQLTGFSYDYGFIDRMHPAYRCHIIDSNGHSTGESLFISTFHGVTNKYNNKRKKLDSFTFSFFHKFFFIKNRSARDLILGTLCLLVCIMSLSGLILWWKLRKRPQMHLGRVRKLHRVVGLFAFILSFWGALSGLIHTVMAYTADSPETPLPRRSLVDQLSPNHDLTKISLGQKPVAIAIRQINGEAVYQFRYGELSTADYFKAEDLEPIENGEFIYVAEIAQQVLVDEIEHKDFIGEFSTIYPRINRFLPVHAIQGLSQHNAADGSYQKREDIFVSAITGSITRRNDQWDNWNQILFQNLHSWAFLPDPLRSIWLIILACAVMISSLLGLILFIRPKS